MNYLEEIQSGKLALDYVPAPFRTPDVCLAAVQRNGRSLRHVPYDLRTQEICLTAVLESGEALSYVPPGTDLGAIRPEAEEAADWERVKDAIRHHGVDMGHWHGIHGEWDPKSEGTCGTHHCIAGWAQALSKDPEIRHMNPADAGVRLLPRHARLFIQCDLTRKQILEIP